MSRPRVVLPEPGGPQKTIDLMLPVSMADLRAFPEARRCSCPTNSSRVRGRIRAASGWAVSRALKRLSSCVRTLDGDWRNFLGITKQAKSERRTLDAFDVLYQDPRANCEVRTMRQSWPRTARAVAKILKLCAS